jgi:hypothetical protein
MQVGGEMSPVAVVFLCVVAAAMLGRAALTHHNNEPHASYAQIISCAAYLTLLLWGTIPLTFAWCVLRVLQFYVYPSPYQTDMRRYYPDTLLHIRIGGGAVLELVTWFAFQQIR